MLCEVNYFYSNQEILQRIYDNTQHSGNISKEKRLPSSSGNTVERTTDRCSASSLHEKSRHQIRRSYGSNSDRARWGQEYESFMPVSVWKAMGAREPPFVICNNGMQRCKEDPNKYYYEVLFLNDPWDPPRLAEKSDVTPHGSKIFFSTLYLGGSLNEQVIASVKTTNTVLDVCNVVG